ncbi:type VII secretion-associated protein [Mycobacterium kansasii]|uniref:type VII secretion-associated protein n=1 Tax=Mycobacterium kansasii TaxID=1768 RepID=UPI000CDDE0FD|nr:type VII secretion-associated protein [Mycobacterium kansasii]POY03269.1 type VII secretion-associated protein [Mycobacterium kansasii]POY30153.1 type VII secretion-associated protein [Mycobacterium kansasii]POY34607.1 type VII secretion-associated protein [Mycobacterium kansasii]
MSTHPVVIEAGPGAIRRLCCDAGVLTDTEVRAAALDAIDDQVALVAERPVAVAALWSATLRRLACDHGHGMVVVHPSWWPVARVGVVTRAARAVAAGDLVVRPRSWLLTRAAAEVAAEVAAEAVVVEIADGLVAVVDSDVMTAVPRLAKDRVVADEVAGVVAGMTRGTGAAVVIDVPGTIAGAAALATAIAGALRGRQAVAEVDDARLSRLAKEVPEKPTGPSDGSPRVERGARAGRFAGLAAAGVALTVLVVAATAHHGATAVPVAPTTFLVEGRVALIAPAGWPTQRVIGGPGSARVQLTSPTDPEVALHITQSQVPGETLTQTVERLRRAVDAEPAGVFVDFNPSGVSAGRPSVTYRELRAGHDVWWTVLLDGGVRISIGCQSRPGAQDAVRDVCERAVRSAHAVG